MKTGRIFIWSLLAFVLIFFAFFELSPRHRDQRFNELLSTSTWQRMVAPGELSKVHAFLKNDCAACHTAVKGVEAFRCIVCHANNTALLQRQPTAFHADIGNCTACHHEHQGAAGLTTTMDHLALSRIGLKHLMSNPDAETDDRSAAAALTHWIQERDAWSGPVATSVSITDQERVLNCAACHGNKDRHVGLFGHDCSACHGTTTWSIPQFRHPPPTSMDCAQCHQAPPSHYMMHFKMISMPTAGVTKAVVTQCFLCHQTTSWNDIKGVGYYKHH